MGREFDTSVIILIVGLVRLAVDRAKLPVLPICIFIPFVGPIDRMEGRILGRRLGSPTAN
jgi:hypothetical protein